MSDWKTYPQEVPEGFERITFYSHSLSFYFIGSYSGFKRGTNGSVGEVWSGEYVRRIRTGDLWKYDDDLPPPHSPTPPNDTPLVEAAATGGEITVENMRNEGWIIIEKYSRVYHDPVMISPCGNFKFYFVQMGNGWLSCRQGELRPNITTMTELRTLIKWLS